jgi:RNA polymerase sigma factor (sigma-70 family)
MAAVLFGHPRPCTKWSYTVEGAKSVVAMHQNNTDEESAPSAVEQSYVQYRAELMTFFARRAREPSSVEDLVQVVYERLLRYRPRAPVKDPEGYLFRTARRVLMRANHRARVNQDRYLGCDETGLEARVEELSSLWIQEDGGAEIAHEEFYRVLEQLPGNCRIALVRQRCDGWSYQQIADELQVSRNTVKDYIVRALEHFRVHFEMSSADRTSARDSK